MKENSERRLFLSLLDGSRRYFILGVLAALLMTFCDMLIPQMLRVTVDSCIGDAEPELPAALSAVFAAAGGRVWLKGHLWAAALAVVLTAALGAMFRWFSTLENAKGGEQLVKTAHDRLYSHIVRLPYAWHMSHAAGDIIQRCTSDVNMLKEFCSEQLYNLVRVVLMIALALGFMAAMHAGLTLAVLAFVPLIAGYSTFFMFRVRDQFTQCDENEGLLSAIAQENLTGVRVVRAFGAEAREDRKFRAQNDIYTNAWMKLCVYLAWFWAFGDLASGLQVLTVVALGAWLCVHGTLSPGSYLAFISYNGMLVWPIRTLGRMISELSKTEVSMHRIAEILNAEPENSGEADAGEDPGRPADSAAGERGVTLSGGQRQRVAIARLLTEHKPVMIFDDSLSAVDAETDSRIRKALREELGEATVFLISHRVSTLMHADRILVMRDGGIAEAGTHEELAAQNGLYAKTWRLQSLPEEDAV